MQGVVDRMQVLIKSGDMRGFTVMAEMRGLKVPAVVLTGSHLEDKLHALAAVTQAKEKLLDAIEEDEADEPPPKFGNSR